MTTNIAISANLSDYFRDVVHNAMRGRQIAATEAASSYLVGLLSDYAHPDDDAGSTLNQPLTFLLRDALNMTGPERFRRLRALGDGVLYVLGFFRSHIDVRGVDRTYVISVGSSAYQHAAAMLRMSARPAEGPNVLGELADKFECFSDVLNDVAEGIQATGARDERSVLKLYETWLRSGSSRLADELSSRGIIPTRGKGGIH